MQDSTQFTYPGGMKGWVDLGVGYILRCLPCPLTVTHPSVIHLIAIQPGVEPKTSWSWVWHANHYASEPPNYLQQKPGSINSVLYSVSQKKNSQNCFWHNFVKFPSTLIIFGIKMAKTILLLWHKLGEVKNECTLHNFVVLAISMPKNC